MDFVKFQQYTPGKGLELLSDYIGYLRSEGEDDLAVIKRLGYSRSDILFYEKTYQITIYEGNDHSNYDQSPRFVLEIELPSYSDYIFLRDIGAFLDFTKEYLPAIEILNRNSRGNKSN